ncbi:hypothetical protein BGX23_001451 [Mortierella sp. AD031]|nr:hypothetical protein BGX23_001451 [Mortierella sp. AD031]KAG0213617.1 hypothetical protein BGX33_002823 [Mortierella sp. NVP41]
MPLTRQVQLALPVPAMLSMNSRSDPAPFSPSFHPTLTFTLTAAGLLSPKIKCTTDNKKDCYTFQSKSDSSNRNMTIKDHKSNLVCKIKSKGDHLLDLYLTTDSKEITVQFRDMIAFKKAVEKNALQYKKMTSPYSSEFDYDRSDRFMSENGGSGNVCWAFEFEGQIYKWTAGGGQGILAPPGSDVLLCHSTSLGPATRVAKLQSSHTGASDKLIIYSASTANVLDKTGLHILLLASVLSLTEIMNERSRELIDFD